MPELVLDDESLLFDLLRHCDSKFDLDILALRGWADFDFLGSVHVVFMPTEDKASVNRPVNLAIVGDQELLVDGLSGQHFVPIRVSETLKLEAEERRIVGHTVIRACFWNRDLVEVLLLLRDQVFLHFIVARQRFLLIRQ